MRKNQSIWKKGGAFALSVCLALTQTGIAPAFSQTLALAPAHRSESSPAELSSLFANAVLPENLGLIKERYAAPLQSGGFRGLILIQDAHDIPDAQRSIDQLLRYFRENHNVRLVGLEGASGPLDTLLFRSFPESRILGEVMDSYVARGELSGAVLTAVTGPDDMDFYGTEDAGLYEKDIDAFLTSLSARKDFEARIQKLRRHMTQVKKELYSPELLEVDEAHEKFQAGGADLEELLHRLSGPAAAHPEILNEERFPSLVRVLKEIKPDQASEEAYLTAETKMVASKIAVALKPHAELQEFHEKQQAFETEHAARGEFLDYLLLINQKLGLRVPVSEKLEQEARDFRMLRAVEGEAFFNELQIFMTTLKGSLFRSPLERRADEASSSLELLGKTARLELGRGEWRKLQAALVVQGQTEVAGDPIPEKLKNVEMEILACLSELAGKNPFVEFYRLAEARERAMSEHLRAEMKSRNAPVSVLVTGGFHSEGLAEQLRAAGISYLLVTPHIQNLPEDPAYLEHMQGKVTWSSYFHARFGRIPVHEAFSEAVADKLAAAYEHELHGGGNTLAYLKVWREQILKQLAAEKHLERASEYTRYLDKIRVRGLSPAERDSLREAWRTRVTKFISDLRVFHEQGKLDAGSVYSAMSRPAAAAWTSVMVAGRGATVPLRWTEDRFEMPDRETLPDSGTAVIGKATPPVIRRIPASNPRNVPAVVLNPLVRRERIPEAAVFSAAGGPLTFFDTISQILRPEIRQSAEVRLRNGAESLLTRTYPAMNLPPIRALRSRLADSFNLSEPFSETGSGLRSELRPTPLLDNHSVVSFQMEAGLPTHFLNWVRATHGDELADLVAQSTVTGGLGALMPDLFEGWKGNNTDVTAILPIWEEIKNVPKPRGGLGQFLREGMEKVDINLSVELTITSRFRAAVLARDSKAKQILDKKIKVQVFREKSTVYGTPHYFLDAYYLKDESLPDTEENRVRIFDEVYNDDNASPGLQYWRYVHMAIYRQASEKLILELQNRHQLKKDIIMVDNEGFVSLPAKRLPTAKRHHMNHTVFLPGMEQPGEVAYELLEFPEWMRSFIVHDGRISIADYVALTYDAITGVGLVEHTPKLRDGIFPAEFHTVKGFREGDVRNTNGVFLPKWQAEERRLLIEKTKGQLGFPAAMEDKEFFERMEREMPAVQKDFEKKNEFVAAQGVARFLVWLRNKQKKTGASDWLQNTLQKYSEPGLSDADKEEQVRQFIEAVERAVRMQDPVAMAGAWDEIEHKYSRLRDVLMEDPIVSNVRRQVQYKGPDKWKDGLEFLENPSAKDIEKWREFFGRLERDQSALDYFKKNAGRVVIGGRTFAPNALQMFQEIKDLVVRLGLEDKITTIENYNIFEAPILFQAMAGVVMIADEDLEASATSMMKGATNFAEIIGVFGGANPEIWKIIDKATGREIDSLDATGKPAISHDELAAKLRSGEWEITNGRLVQYLPFGDGAGHERSNQDGGKRRPSTESLLFSLFDLKKDYSDSAKRRQRQYNVLAASYKVDILVSQSRAHRQVWEQTLETVKDRQEVLARTRFDFSDLEKFFAPGRPAFTWRIDGGRVVQTSQPGLAGFLEGFRRLRAQGDKNTRGQLAAQSLRHHALEERANGGSVFPYLKALLADFSDAAKPLKDKIEALSRLAAETDDEERALALNLQAMDFADRYLVQMAGSFFENYLNFGPDDHEQVIRYENLFQNPVLKEMVVRYLDSHPNASRLLTDNTGVVSYRLDRNGQQLLININLRARAMQAPGESGVEKSWANIQFDAKLRKFWEDLGEPSGKYLFQAFEPNKNKTYRFYDGSASRSPVVVGIPTPPGLQVLAFKKIEAQFISYLSSTLHHKPVEHVAPLELLTEDLKAAMERGDDLVSRLEHVATLDRRTAERLFTEHGVPQVMALVAFLAPGLLDRMASWNRNTFRALKRVVKEYPDVFREGKIVFLNPTNHRTTMVVARVLGEERVIMPIQFIAEHISVRDRVPKVWTLINDLGEWGRGLDLKRDGEYEPYDVIRQRYYGAVSGSQLLTAGWEIGIPVHSPKHDGGAAEYPLGFQLLRMGYKRGERELRQEVERLASRPKVAGLKVAVNLKEVGAVLRDGRLTYQESLQRAKKLLLTLRERGVGRVYFYGGLYEMSHMSDQVHRGRSDKRMQHTVSRNRRVVGTVRDYPTKKITYKHPNAQTTFEHEDDPNPFSILGLNRFNPQLSATWHEAGSEERSRRLFRELVEEAHALGMEVTVDFIPWLAPDAIDENNYHWTFFKEISDDENHQFRGRDEDGKLAFLKDLSSRNEGFVAVRIAERDKAERVILVRHLQGLGAPNVDQIILNPYLPDVRNYYVQALKELSYDGVDEVRIDLAAVYLKEWFANGSGYFTPEYYWSLHHVRPDLSAILEQEVQANPQPWKPIFETARRNDPRTENKKIRFTNEAYFKDQRDKLQELGATGSYYPDFFKNIMEVSNGAPASNLAGAVQHALETRGTTTIYPSNYDQFPWIKAGQGISHRAVFATLALLARLGVDVMIDMRDWMEHSGQLFPIAGGDQHPDKEHDHPFASQAEMEILLNPDRVADAIEDSTATYRVRDILSAVTAVEAREPLEFQMLENSDASRYITFAWKVAGAKPEWKIFIADLKPHAGAKLHYVKVPDSGALGDDLASWVAVDAETHGRVDANLSEGKLEDIGTYPEMPFRIVSLQRPELRIHESRRGESFWGQGNAKIRFLAREKREQILTREQLDPYLEKIRTKIGAMTPGEDLDRAQAVFGHLESLVTGKPQSRISVTEEQRWLDGSYYFGNPGADKIQIGSGSLADVEFGAQILFAAAAQSYALSLHTPALSDDLDLLAQKVFGSDERTGFWQAYQDYRELASEPFLNAAIDGFDAFNEGTRYFETRSLFEAWLDAELRNDRVPVVEQAAFLAARLWARRDFIAFSFQRLKALRRQSNFGFSIPASIADGNAREIESIEREIARYFKILYPMMAFSSYRYSYFSAAEQIRDSFRATIERRLREEDAQQPLSNKIPPDEFPARVDKAVRVIMAKGTFTYGMEPYSVLGVNVAETPSRKAYENYFKIHEALSRKSFKGGLDWLNERVSRYGGRGNIVMEGVGPVPQEELETVSDLFSGYRPDVDMIAHVNNRGTYDSWTVLSYIADESSTEGLTVITTDRAATGQLIAPAERLYYDLDPQTNHLTIQRYTPAVWGDMLRWLHGRMAEGGSTVDSDFWQLWTNLFSVRKRLTPHGSVKNDSYYSPGGLDLEAWVNRVLELQLISDQSFWQMVRSEHDSYRSYFETLDGASARRSAEYFWYYTLFTHPQGIFAWLSEHLKYEEGTRRLTRESARDFIDGLYAIWWSGIPRGDRALGLTFLFREITSFIRIHPDGITVEDPEALKHFLTRYLTPQAGAADPTQKLRVFEAWVSRVNADYPDLANEDSLHMPQVQNTRLPDPDSTDALMRTRSEESVYSPERFPAKDLLQPERHPWRNIRDYSEKETAFTDREAVWVGTYQAEGLRIPGASFLLKFPTVAEGTPLLVTVRDGRVTVKRVPAEPSEAEIRGDSEPMMTADVRAIIGTEPLLDVALEVMQRPYGVSGKSWEQGWEKIPEIPSGRMVTLVPGQKMLDDGFYRGFSTETDLVGLPLDKTVYFHVPALQADSELVVQKAGNILIFYRGNALSLSIIGQHDLGAAPARLSGRAPTVERLPDLLSSVAHQTPQSTVQYLALNALAGRLKDRMQSGRGYTQLDIEDSETGDVTLDLDNGRVVIPNSLVNQPEAALEKLQEALERQDPVQEMETHKRELVKIWRGDSAFQASVAVPEEPELVDAALMESWPAESRERYELLSYQTMDLRRRIRVARRLEAYRAAHKDELGKVSADTRFRMMAREALEASSDEEKLFFFRSRDNSEYSSVQSLVKSGGKIINEGIGIATAGHFVYRSDPRIIDKEKTYYELVPPSGESSVRYVFVRYKRQVAVTLDGGRQDTREIPAVILFDLESGSVLHDEQFAFAQKKEKLEELKRGILEDARKAGTRLDLNVVSQLIEEFLARFSGGLASEILDREVAVLGHLRQILPQALNSHEFVPEINYAVLRMLFEDILKRGPEHAVERSLKLTTAFSQDPKRALVSLQFYLEVHSDELGLDIESVIRPAEGGESTLAAISTFNGFLESVLLPAVAQSGEGDSSWTEEKFWETFFEEIVGVRAHVVSALDLNPELAAEDGSRWLNAELAQRAGLIRALETPPNPTQGFFIRDFFHRRHAAKLQADLARQAVEQASKAKIQESAPVPAASQPRVAEHKSEIPSDEIRQRATFVTPYGGVQGIGGSSALVEYLGHGEQEKDAILIDMGAYLNDTYSMPKAPRSLSDFSTRPKGLFITHDHLDHVGSLVAYWRDALNKQVPVYVPADSYELLKLVLGFQADRMSQSERQQRLPNHFTREEAEELMKQVIPLKPNEWYQVSPKMKVRYHTPVGHLHGAASLIVSTPDSNSFFSGDISVRAQGPTPGYAPLPEEIAAQIDQAQVESTYGMEKRISEEEQEKALLADMADTLKNRGARVLLPAFANGRSQRVLLLLLENFKALAASANGGLKIYVDGQAAVFTRWYLKWYPEVFAPYRELLDKNVVIIDETNVELRGKMRSEALDRDGGQKTIIIASAGNASQGRSLFWATRLVNDANSAIFFTGYMDPQETGSRLMEAARQSWPTFDFKKDISQNAEDLDSFQQALQLQNIPLLAKIREYKLSGHAAGMEIMTQVLAPMTSLRQVMIGHGSVARGSEVKKWILAHHPEWHPVILQTKDARKGAIPATYAELAVRKAFFEGLAAEPLPSMAETAVPVEIKAEVKQAEKKEEKLPALVLEKGRLTRASRRELLARRLAEVPDLTVNAARTWLEETVEQAGEKRSAGTFGETAIREDLKELRSSKTELRALVRPVLERLARLESGLRRDTEAAASRFAEAVQDLSFDSVALALESEALENPVYAGWYAPRSHDDGVLAQIDALAGVRARHPGHDERLAAFIDQQINVMENHFTALLKDPNRRLDFSFGFQPQGSSKAEEWLLRYIVMVEKLRIHDPSRVRGNIEILVTAEEKRSFSKEFRQKIEQSPVAHFFELQDNTLTALRIDDYLKQNPKALIYGFSELTASNRYPSRLVKSLAGVDHTVPVALFLTSALAQEDSHMLSAELLRQIPEWLPEIVTWNNGRLEITTLAMELVYRYEVTELIASMA